MFLDDLFTSTDEIPSEDSSTLRRIERVNPLPDRGGMVREKGVVASHVHILEAHTGTQSRRAKGLEVEAALTGPEGSTQQLLTQSAGRTIRPQVSANRTSESIQEMDTHRDENLHHGYNYKGHMWRTLGQEQLRGTTTYDWLGPKVFHEEPMKQGSTDVVHKPGNVQLTDPRNRSSAVSARTVNVRPTLSGLDAVQPQVRSSVKGATSLASSEHVIGTSDAQSVAFSKRVTGQRVESRGHRLHTNQWDSIGAPERPADTSSVQGPTALPHHPVSRRDSSKGRTGQESYQSVASVSGRHATSSVDSTPNLRSEAEVHTAVPLTHGIQEAIRRIGARVRGTDEDVAQGPQTEAVPGLRQRDRRMGPSQPLDPREQHVGVATASAAPVASRRSSVLQPVTAPAAPPSRPMTSATHQLNRTERTTTHDHDRRTHGSVTELVRSLFGRVTNEQKESRLRVEAPTALGTQAAVRGVGTRAASDDTHTHDLPKLGLSVQTRTVASEADSRDRSVLVRPVESKHPTHLNPLQTPTVSSTRGLSFSKEG